jgi:putative oxidoreductase
VGDFGHFVQYTGMVNSFLPARMIPALAWMATCAETVFGLCLILGIYRRAVATGSAALLLMFALAMSVSFGVKSAIDYAVFSASSAAFLLVAMRQMAAGKNKTEKSAG